MASPKAGKVEFTYSARVARDFKDGKITHVGKGTDTPKENLSRVVAEKFQRMGIGKITGEAAAINLEA